jgi:thioredoxin reductase (NADPH)
MASGAPGPPTAPPSPGPELATLLAPLLHESSVQKVFAAGDVRANSVKRVASGVGQGSVCVRQVHRAPAE